ncbi:MAG: CHAT domain-containing protein [Candidatus Eiseniibacteriota bacterium]
MKHRLLALVMPALLALVLAAVLPHGPLRADPGDDLSQARSLQSQSRWAASESLATLALQDLERSSRADSVAIAEAYYLIGRARLRGVGFNDSTGIRAATLCLGIRQRALGPRHTEVATAHTLVGSFLEGTGRSDSAMVHIKLALDIRRGGLAPNDTLIADSWNQLALAYRDRGDFRGAITAWDSAIVIRNQAQGAGNTAAALHLADQAICWMELDDLDRARTMLHQSIAIFEQDAPDHVRRWVPYNNLADVERTAGSAGLSVDLVREGLRLAERYPSENRGPIITLRTNLTTYLSYFKDYEGGYAVCSELVPLAEARYGPRHWRTFWIRVNQAEFAARLGDPDALTMLADAEQGILAAGGPALRFLDRAQSLQAMVLYNAGEYERARAKAEESFRNPGAARVSLSVRSSLYLVYVPILEALRDTAALDSSRLKLTTWIERGPATEIEAELRYLRARASRAIGLEHEAWNDALRAEELSSELVRHQLEALPNERAIQTVGRESVYLDLLLVLATSGSQDQLMTAWDRLVRARGRALAEIARRRLPVALRSDTLLAGAHARWVEAQRRVAQMTVSISASGGDSLARVRLEELRRSAADAERDFSSALAAKGASSPRNEIGLSDVRARLGPGQALVSFAQSHASVVSVMRSQAMVDSGRVLALIARGPSGPGDMVDLGTIAQLQGPLDRWRSSLAASPGGAASGSRDARTEQECRKLGQAVRDLLWEPIAARLGDVTDVYLVGESSTADLPWQALPQGDRSYLVEAGPRIHLLNAERELVEGAPAIVSPAPTGGASSSLLAVGAPDFDRAGASTEPVALAAAIVRASPDPCASAPAALTPLPQTRKEVESVSRSWKANPAARVTVLLGPEANEALVKQEAPGRSVVHLATHGVMARDTCATGGNLRAIGGVAPLPNATDKRPSVSPASAAPAAPAAAPSAAAKGVPMPSPWMGRRVWLALAGANRAMEHKADENEGLLTAEEVIMLDLAGTDWVVLSACHSGLGESWSREGTIGIRSAFNLAGARSVIASAWSVEDEATREWMEALYEARRSGSTVAAQATEAASRSVLKARCAASRSTHPFYWAAFSASGE